MHDKSIPEVTHQSAGVLVSQSLYKPSRKVTGLLWTEGPVCFLDQKSPQVSLNPMFLFQKPFLSLLVSRKPSLNQHLQTSLGVVPLWRCLQAE